MTDLKITRGHSCAPCQSRKIRCNGQTPCAYCIKTGKDCVRPSRAVHGRPRPTKPGSPNSSGHVVASGDQRRYVEDNKLWDGLSEELEPRDLSSKDEPTPQREKAPPSHANLIFGYSQGQFPEMLHPSAIQSFRLWQIYLSNVHPLTKIVHGPSVQEEILRVLSDSSATTLPTEALMFSIYLMAVVSLSDEECRSLLDEPRDKHLARYRYATEAALSRVDFLRSTDLKVLQAFTMYLLALRHLCDDDVLWLLTGLATRMGQRMGLHRERSLQDLSPFEAEMRRRVWWQIIILDGRAAQVTGASRSHSLYLLGDTNQPVNVNDGDLVPAMGLPPPPSPITTEMAFCSIRIEIGLWMRQQKVLPGYSGSHDGRPSFLKAIDEIENYIEHKYLRNIDTDIPLNRLALGMARSSICQFRISTCHPMHRPRENRDLDPKKLEMILKNSLEIIQYDIMAHTTKSLEGFLWHVSNFFPFETFVLMVGTLPSCATSQLTDAAWDVINQVYEHHPSFISNNSRVLYRALGDLTSKSWNRSLDNAKKLGLQPPAEPPCIGKLLRERSHDSQNKAAGAMDLGDFTPSTPISLSSSQIQDPNRHSEPGDWGHNIPQEMVDISFETHGDDISNSAMGMDWDFWQCLLSDKTANVPEDGNNTFFSSRNFVP